MNILHTDFGPVPVSGFVKKSDVPALERCAKANAQRAWESGQECQPLTIEQAMKMPEWQKRQAITSQGYIYER